MKQSYVPNYFLLTNRGNTLDHSAVQALQQDSIWVLLESKFNMVTNELGNYGFSFLNPQKYLLGIIHLVRTQNFLPPDTFILGDKKC